MRCSLVIAAVLSMASVTGAHACRDPKSGEALFFLPPLSNIAADFIAEVTITQIVTPEDLDMSDERKRFYQVALGSIGTVIKGGADATAVKIAIMPTSCGPYLDASLVGRTGVVAGSLTKSRDGTWVLFARGESQAQRERRNLSP